MWQCVAAFAHLAPSVEPPRGIPARARLIAAADCLVADMVAGVVAGMVVAGMAMAGASTAPMGTVKMGTAVGTEMGVGGTAIAVCLTRCRHGRVDAPLDLAKCEQGMGKPDGRRSEGPRGGISIAKPAVSIAKSREGFS